MSVESHVTLRKQLYPYCLVLAGFRNGFERVLHTQTLFVSQFTIILVITKTSLCSHLLTQDR